MVADHDDDRLVVDRFQYPLELAVREVELAVVAVPRAVADPACPVHLVVIVRRYEEDEAEVAPRFVASSLYGFDGGIGDTRVRVRVSPLAVRPAVSRRTSLGGPDEPSRMTTGRTVSSVTSGDAFGVGFSRR